MDDGRTFMAPLKPGWRWTSEGLKLKLEWERMDQELTAMEITRMGLLGSMGGVEEFICFTLETGEDFWDDWLSTLDLSLFVDGNSFK